MQTLRDNGMNPIAQPVRITSCPTESPPSPAKQAAASSLFSPAQAAEIVQPQPDEQWGSVYGQRPVRGVVLRRDAANQEVYDVSSSLIPFFTLSSDPAGACRHTSWKLSHEVRHAVDSAPEVWTAGCGDTLHVPLLLLIGSDMRWTRPVPVLSAGA